MINNLNCGWNNGFSAQSYSTSSSFTQSNSFAKPAYHNQCAPKPRPQELWCLPIQNFRIDGGKTNLYSQKVSSDWPEFRPQSPIFSGPTVRQDTTNLMGTPAPNYNFDDGYAFGSSAPSMINQLLPGFQRASQNYVDPYNCFDYRVGGMPGKW